CRVGQLQGAMSLTGSTAMFILCSCLVKNKKRTCAKKGRRLETPPLSLLRPALAQCAVSVEESASTAGSVLTEVSVGLAFSSSHSIGSGVGVSARARTSVLGGTGTESGALLVVFLDYTQAVAVSFGVSALFQPPAEGQRR